MRGSAVCHMAARRCGAAIRPSFDSLTDGCGERVGLDEARPSEGRSDQVFRTGPKPRPSDLREPEPPELAALAAGSGFQIVTKVQSEAEAQSVLSRVVAVGGAGPGARGKPLHDVVRLRVEPELHASWVGEVEGVDQMAAHRLISRLAVTNSTSEMAPDLAVGVSEGSPNQPDLKRGTRVAVGHDVDAEDRDRLLHLLPQRVI